MVLGAESGARTGVQLGAEVAVAAVVHSCVAALWETMS